MRMKIVASVMMACAAMAGCEGPARAQAAKTAVSVADEQELANTQQQLIHLLKVSPVLTQVVERDPSLLGNAEYVNKTNPELGQFLTSHPEVARNPDFYLFSGFKGQPGQRREQLEQKVWPENNAPLREDPTAEMWRQISPVIALFCAMGSAVWLIRFFVENRRWQRTYKMQMDAHEKLMERFGSSEQLLAYLEGSGKKFLDMPPVPELPDGGARMPNVVARVFTSLQAGLVLALLGAGLLVVRHVNAAAGEGLTVAGVMFLMPGIAFIVSAAVSWSLAERLGLLPSPKPVETGERG